MCFVYVSAHADKRIKERLPGMKSAKRCRTIAEEAYIYGVRIAASKGAEHAYIARCTKENPEYAGRDLVLYADRVFVFDGVRLVTMLPCCEGLRRRIECSRSKSRRRYPLDNGDYYWDDVA